jgi:hypothetical protein
MKTITSLSQIINAAKNQTLYIRWSRGPQMDRKMGKSLDQVSGQRHNGLSAQNVHADDAELLARMLQEYSFLQRKDCKIYCWIFSAQRNGTDSDGAPTVDADTIVEIGKVSDGLIAKCAEFSTAAHNRNTKYAYNAHKPEHFERNAKLDADYKSAWDAIK